MAQSYEKPAEVMRWYLSDRQRMAEVEAVVVENNVADFVLEQGQGDRQGRAVRRADGGLTRLRCRRRRAAGAALRRALAASHNRPRHASIEHSEDLP